MTGNHLETWVTVSSYAFPPSTLVRLLEHKPDALRINMARERFEWATEAIAIVSANGFPTSNIYLDVANSKPRLHAPSQSSGSIQVRREIPLTVSFNTTNGATAPFVPRNFPRHPRVGDLIVVGDGSLELRITEVGDHHVIVHSRQDGSIPPGTSLQIRGHEPTPHGLDRAEIDAVEEVIARFEISLMLSFVNTPEDVARARTLFPGASSIVPKVETAAAAENLTDILEPGKYFVIGRGDLGLSIGVERIGATQARILETARTVGARAMVATGILDSLEYNNVPSRAEVVDVYNSYSEGAAGILLTSETAGSKDPLKVVRMARKLVDYLGVLD